MKKIAELVSNKNTPKAVVVMLMAISCLTGFYFNFRWSLSHYRPGTKASPYYDTTYYFTNNMIIRLKSSGEIDEIKQYLYPDQTVGFFTDTPSKGELSHMVFQSLLAPVLLMKGSPQDYRHVIMHLENKDPEKTAEEIGHKLIRNLGNNLFIAEK